MYVSFYHLPPCALACSLTTPMPLSPTTHLYLLLPCLPCPCLCLGLALHALLTSQRGQHRVDSRLFWLGSSCFWHFWDLGFLYYLPSSSIKPPHLSHLSMWQLLPPATHCHPPAAPCLLLLASFLYLPTWRRRSDRNRPGSDASSCLALAASPSPGREVRQAVVRAGRQEGEMNPRKGWKRTGEKKKPLLSSPFFRRSVHGETCP